MDIGNSRTKLGLFVPPGAAPLPRPERMFSWGPPWRIAETEDWLAAPPDAFDWRIASVNRVGTARLLDWLGRRGASRVQVLYVTDIPLALQVDEPDKVGLDRLANALAADRLRAAGRGAIVVDLGSAITVDVVSPDWRFSGGRDSARHRHVGPRAARVHRFVALGADVGTCPAAGRFGQNHLGLFAIGPLLGGHRWRARTRRPARRAMCQKPQLFVTGGAGAAAAGLLTGPGEPPAVLVPHLTLAGIALAGPPD